MAIHRYSSRHQQRLDQVFLAQRLQGALSYRRIAGYFRSSIFELIGEEIAHIPDVRIVCNSELDLADIQVSQMARETALLGHWNRENAELEALLHRERYQKLYVLLCRGNVQIRVVPRENTFMHGKAGVIETATGKTCFLGSINETKNAFAKNYEILWEDTSPEGVAWVEAEFESLWQDSYPLPDAIIQEIKRMASRVEVTFDGLKPQELPGAAMVESPLYRGGEQLQPWQRDFVALFMRHREIYGKARLLLADEVGLGKTLSLGTSALVSALLDDGPILILCPSTLTLQWQVELKDRLGIPSAVWLSNRKQWLDIHNHLIKTRGPEDILNCPCRIAIVSTGLITHMTRERECLLTQRYATVVLDEAHKARRQGGLGEKKNQPNNLLDFMLKMASRSQHVLLGTATPIQTEVEELWDLMRILNQGEAFVLGKEYGSLWQRSETSLPYLKGESPSDIREAWELLRNPLPPAQESGFFQVQRMYLELPEKQFYCSLPYSDLPVQVQSNLWDTLEDGFFQFNNPILRHTVLRKREILESQGLLEKIAVSVHPLPQNTREVYPGQPFFGLGLLTNHPFNLAYEAAENFTKAMVQRTKAAGFMKSLLLQRICSSFHSGICTAEKILERNLSDDDEDMQELREITGDLSSEEIQFLQQIIRELNRPEARDPKLAAVRYFLNEHRVEEKTWLEHGCIIFSQYYDTAFWVAQELSQFFPTETIGVYAGLGKSGVFYNQGFVQEEREVLKKAVRNREIRLMIATDAACEGLNLQTLGSLINIDLPWNPSRLEQRLGRIKRFGQARRCVDMLNLVYHDTQDEKIYQVLSRRLKDKFDIFGGLPDTIEDTWIADIESMEAEMDKYVHLRQQAKNAFEFRYQSQVNAQDNRWEMCHKVLSRKDILEKLSLPW